MRYSSGVKKAAIATAHHILVSSFHILRDGVVYRELGGDYFDKLNPARTTLRKLSRRVEKLGFQLMPTQPAVAPNSVETSPDGS